MLFPNETPHQVHTPCSMVRNTCKLQFFQPFLHQQQNIYPPQGYPETPMPVNQNNHHQYTHPPAIVHQGGLVVPPGYQPPYASPVGQANLPFQPPEQQLPAQAPAVTMPLQDQTSMHNNQTIPQEHPATSQKQKSDPDNTPENASKSKHSKVKIGKGIDQNSEDTGEGDGL